MPALPGDTTRPARGGPQDLFRSAHEAVPLPIIERAEGVRLWDEEGRDYIDISSGPVVSNIGHGNDQVAEAMAAQARTLDYASSRVARHRPNMALTERIARLAGPGYERVCLSSGGSEAVEIALKFLRQYAIATGHPERRRIVTCQPSYHGATIAGIGLSGDEAYAAFLDGFATSSSKIPAPLSYRLPDNHDVESYARYCAECLRDTIEEIGPENVLAFLVEPVGGLATGCVVPPAEYLHVVRQICNQYGVFLVFDEVLCGAGRTGRFLSAHHLPDVQPDVVVLAKGLGAGYAPLGATLAPAEMVDHLASLTGFGFTHTYGANPIVCAAGLAVLDVYESQELERKARERGAYLRSGLEALMRRSPVVGDVRGLGLLMAVEIVADQQTKAPFPASASAVDRLRVRGLEHGLMIYARRTAGGKYGDWFMLSPPLVISVDECDELLQRLEATLDAFAADMAVASRRV